MVAQVNLCQLLQVSHKVQSLALCCFYVSFVNDIPDCISSNIRLYADDILLYRTINVMDDCVQLQDDLNALQQWEKGGKCTLIHQNVVNQII